MYLTKEEWLNINQSGLYMSPCQNCPRYGSQIYASRAQDVNIIAEMIKLVGESRYSCNCYLYMQILYFMERIETGNFCTSV